MSLFFIRHTQSEANLQELLGGQANYPLSAQGLLDAQNIAREFQYDLRQWKTAIHKIISSPLPRALQTAQQMAPVLGLNPENILLEPLLKEQAIGRFTGLSYDQLQHERGYVRDRTQRWDWQPEANSEWPGESYRQIAMRVTEFFQQLSENIASQNVLAVTHAVTMRLIYGYLCQMFPAYLEEIPHNGEIWQVDNIEPDEHKHIQHHFYQGSRKSRI